MPTCPFSATYVQQPVNWLSQDIAITFLNKHPEPWLIRSKATAGWRFLMPIGNGLVFSD